MTTATQRESLKVSGEHLAAVLLLGSDYTNDEYIAAVTAAQEAGVGEAYATKVAGTDADALLAQAAEDEGEALIRAAEEVLRSRGLDPAGATYREFAEALGEVSP